MEKGFYHPSIGYWQTVVEPSEETLKSFPKGTISVPLKPGPGYNFNGTEWIPPTQQWLDETKALEVRAIRNKKLKFVDRIVSNPLRWTDLSFEKQQAVKDYRQALLDITGQPGFPHNVVWPEQPQI